MALHKIKKGLDIPVAGEPRREIGDARTPRRVAVLGPDYVGMKPTMHVKEGDEVRRGQLLFEDKKTEGVRYTAPASGRVVAINRGERRAFQSVVIELGRSEVGGREGGDVSFRSYLGKHPGALPRDQIRDLLLESGQWPALRRRPFSRVALPGEVPSSIFVTAHDTNPLAPPMHLLLEGHEEDFQRGLEALARLTDGPVYVCAGPEGQFPLPQADRIRLERFAGPHPAGTAGLHIHTLDPVNREKVVWYIGLQDVIGYGYLLRTGQIYVDRVISLAGPPVLNPRLLRTRLGASTADLVEGELLPPSLEASQKVRLHGEEIPAEPYRVISGSILSGRTAQGDELGYLGRYHQQVTVLAEDRERELLGWLTPGMRRYSAARTFVSKLIPGRRFELTTSTQGSQRAIVPISVYDKVMAFDVPATQLLRSLSVRDVEQCERLGCLELDEEDVSLPSFVCPGKNDYGPMLRDVLTIIEKEG